VQDAIMPYFPYGPVEIAHLQDRDPALGAVIDRIGPIERAVQPELFTARVHSIVSQQISNAAAATVWRRLGALLGAWTPERLTDVAWADLHACGLPRRKADWIQRLSRQVMQGDLDLSILPTLPDAAVVQTLSALPGIGVWTAEMLLIFALGRPDVVSRGDQAIQRGMRRLYGLETLSHAQFAHYRERYRPYGTVASFYLWALASGALEEHAGMKR
jgi:DNA-3-methyladenine glycosylase II